MAADSTRLGAGKVLKGEGSPDSTAFWIHSRIHKARPNDARCILHTHMPWSTALYCIENGRLEMCHQNCLRFYDDIAYDPEFNGLVLDETEGNRLCKMMGDKKVLFHANHGKNDVPHHRGSALSSFAMPLPHLSSHVAPFNAYRFWGRPARTRERC